MWIKLFRMVINAIWPETYTHYNGVIIMGDLDNKFTIIYASSISDEHQSLVNDGKPRLFSCQYTVDIVTFCSGTINDDLVVKSKLWAKSILYHVVYRKRLFLSKQPIYMIFEVDQVPASVAVASIVLTRMLWKDSLTQDWPLVPFLLKHTLEIGFGPVNFHNRKCLAMKLIQYIYKFKSCLIMR